MEKLLEIKNLKVQYNTDEAIVYALNDFSLDLGKGEILGVVGETGAGKTTMALSIMKLLPEHVAEVTGGSITYNGEDVFKMSKAVEKPARRRSFYDFSGSHDELEPGYDRGRSDR